ncbi:YciI family protein [Merismopedia glauca]|uniref:YCII-related domain-containing protein n=1 Tax=Merismopedia glauca CCAP 1448/3 TaxID=1296344 RepID=A0A2T1C5A1_9CYAN|nr:YciI family protein [Merismopedia glauca]PSB03450.1 hypothetical protein C7B64_08550 [Merismopedia glauca CCAP 1448/3]
MRFALQCLLAENTDEKRVALRSKHLQYIEANKERIFCGGPTINLDGQPEMMLIILDVANLSGAQDFIEAEPYNQAGVFAQVVISEWRQILPESEPGALLREINSN